MKGLDVSKHNGVLDWGKIKDAGFEFAIIRAGYGKLISQRDTQFENNYAGATTNGLHVGAYWYSYAETAEDALTEAKAFEAVIRGKKFSMPVFLDIEEVKSQRNAGAIVSAFCSFLESRGYYVGVYASKSYFNSYIPDVTSRYCGWVAEWTNLTKPTYAKPWQLWQYTSKGVINGLSGNFDFDECVNELLPETIKKSGRNGYTADETTAKHTIKLVIDDKIVYEREF